MPETWHSLKYISLIVITLKNLSSKKKPVLPETPQFVFHAILYEQSVTSKTHKWVGFFLYFLLGFVHDKHKICLLSLRLYRKLISEKIHFPNNTTMTRPVLSRIKYKQVKPNSNSDQAPLLQQQEKPSVMPSTAAAVILS